MFCADFDFRLDKFDLIGFNLTKLSLLFTFFNILLVGFVVMHLN